MKKLYFLVAFLAVGKIGWAQKICDSCCKESFPYEFCDATGAGVFVACSSNPNADGKAVKAFIPSCVIVDPMPGNAIWQPNGPPAGPAGLLGDDDLNDNPNEEAGAAAQQSSDAKLFNQLPTGQPPLDPDFESDLYPVTSAPGPEPTCGDEPYPDQLYAPDRQAIFDRYVNASPTESGTNLVIPPWKRHWDVSNEGWWDYDELEYDAAFSQWSEDSSNFVNGFDPAHIDETGLTGNEIDEVNLFYNEDFGWLNDEYTYELDSVEEDSAQEADWEACETGLSDQIAQWKQDTANYSKYLGAEAQYQADLTAWNDAGNSYTQVFVQSQAQADADSALHQWLDLCNPPIQPCESVPECCIHVVMDNSVRDFQDPIGIVAQTTGSGPNTFLVCDPTGCESGSFIEVNVTSQFLSDEKVTGAKYTDPSEYNLHPVNLTGFYTALDQGPTTASGYNNYSFYQLMEHEIGHYLGLHHPEQAINGEECPNCYTANPFISPSGILNPNGYQTVMANANIIAATGVAAHYPLSLTDEDMCQFEKLYCNMCGGGSGASPCAYDDGVPKQEREDFEAGVHPNPSTGATELDYTVTKRTLVQITIYDMIGNAIRLVALKYEDAGTYAASLGTESLPSGHYVCRLREGESVAYINVVIQR